MSGFKASTNTVSCAELTFSWAGKAPPVSEPVVKTVAKKAMKKVATKKVAKTAVKTIATKKAVAKKVDSAEEWLERVVKDFKEHPKARPKKRKALVAKVANLIKKSVDGPEVQSVIARLEQAGRLNFNGEIPEYLF